MRKYILHSLLILSALFLASCGFFDKDNTPMPARLTDITAEVKPRLMWTARTGTQVGNDYLKVDPAMSDCAIFVSGENSFVTSINKADGSRNWRVNTGYSLSSGPGVGDGIVVVGGLHGEVVALRQSDGCILWRTSVPGEILANPAIRHGVVVIKSVDGYVRGLSVENGGLLWAYQQAEPNLILRGASAPFIQDHNIIVGFANGNLLKLSLWDGELIWLRQLAVPEGGFAIQRMIDIDADPILYEHRIYAATYQGNITSLDWISGKVLWSRDISSYTGMVADENTVYISDANGFVWSFNADSGLVNWREVCLQARGVTGPVIMGNYLVVGDQQGYLHWLDKKDGHLAARAKVGAKIFATPMIENNVLYVLNNRGHLFAYMLS